MISSGILLIKRAQYSSQMQLIVWRGYSMGQVFPLGNRQISVDIIFPLKTNSLINLNPFSSNNFYTRILYCIIGNRRDVIMIMFKILFFLLIIHRCDIKLYTIYLLEFIISFSFIVIILIIIIF
jgi:hypothetical protein